MPELRTRAVFEHLNHQGKKVFSQINVIVHDLKQERKVTTEEKTTTKNIYKPKGKLNHQNMSKIFTMYLTKYY